MDSRGCKGDDVGTTAGHLQERHFARLVQVLETLGDLVRQEPAWLPRFEAVWDTYGQLLHDLDEPRPALGMGFEAYTEGHR